MEPTKIWFVFSEHSDATDTYATATAAEAVKLYVKDYETQLSEGDVVRVIDGEHTEKFRLATKFVPRKA